MRVFGRKEFLYIELAKVPQANSLTKMRTLHSLFSTTLFLLHRVPWSHRVARGAVRLH